MCLPQPKPSPAPIVEPPETPPAPEPTPEAPVIDEGPRRSVSESAATKTGLARLRIALNLPDASGGQGVNVAS